MMKISACVITKNEEKNIARSILSYKDIVDEIIVVDSESTDDTVKIAEGLGAKVYTRPWTDDFSAAKNFALDKATGDWIIFLDADEYLDAKCNHVLRQVIEEADDNGFECIAIVMYQTNKDQTMYYCATDSLRLLKNDGQIRYANRIHEFLQKNNDELKMFTSKEIIVYHTGYNDPELQRQKHTRNLELLLMEDSKAIEFMQLNHLAEAYYSLREFDKCRDVTERLLALPDFEEVLYTDQKTFRAYRFKVEDMLQHTNLYPESRIAAFVQKTVDDFGNHPEIRVAQAHYFIAYNKIESAIQAMLEAFRMEDQYKAFYENFFKADLGKHYAILSKLFQFKNDLPQAIKYMTESIRVDKYNQQNLFRLLLLLKKETIEDKHRILQSLYSIDQMSDINCIITAAWLSGSNDIFSIYFLKLLKQWPEQATADQAILCKVFFLQKNYEGVLQIAEQHPGEDFYERFKFIALLSMGREIKQENFESIVAVMTELLQAGEDRIAFSCTEQKFVEQIPELMESEGKSAVAALFEKFERWECAGRLWMDAAGMQDENNKKGIRYYNAAHAFYLAGDSVAVVDILQEALPYALAGNHLPIEILGWIGKHAKKNDKELYQKSRRLQSKYEIKYDMTYDQPLSEKTRDGA